MEYFLKLQRNRSVSFYRTPCLFPEYTFPEQCHNPDHVDFPEYGNPKSRIPSNTDYPGYIIREWKDQPIIGHQEFGKLTFGLMTGLD